MPGIKWGAGAPACASPDMQLRKESAASSPREFSIGYFNPGHQMKYILGFSDPASLNASSPPPPQGAQASLRLPHLPRKRKPAVISREATAVMWDQEEQSIHRPTSPSILGKFPGRQAGWQGSLLHCLHFRSQSNGGRGRRRRDDGCGGVSDAAAGAVPAYLLPLSNHPPHHPISRLGA